MFLLLLRLFFFAMQEIRKSVLYLYLYSIYHRIIDGLGLERTFKIILFHPPAMGRVTFHAPNLVLDTPRDSGAATVSLGKGF